MRRSRGGSLPPRSAVITLAAGGAIAGGLWLRDRWGMEGVKPPPPVRLKDYSVKLPVSRPNMIIVRSSPVLPENHTSKDDELKAREEQAFNMVKAAMDAMGGVSLFIQKGDVVVIKPNVAFDKNPDLAATTQPDTVMAVTRLCFGAGARKVIVADNPINNPGKLLLQDQGRRGGHSGRSRADDAQGQLLRAALCRRRDDHRHVADVLPPVP